MPVVMFDKNEDFIILTVEEVKRLQSSSGYITR